MLQSGAECFRGVWTALEGGSAPKRRSPAWAPMVARDVPVARDVLVPARSPLPGVSRQMLPTRSHAGQRPAQPPRQRPSSSSSLGPFSP